ncbi:hypothetical protein KZZ52_46750 [Dactylosporangium sp. AC04546]|uniref:hypothetical protein n=1 Tax=Dactylosporangium sp. AC04546 TaxID=2862460 RepID=UPI001EDDEFE0|nr:hypothetical protein [Dactylosporangium sp. AC04546]WVK81414.1 hypothetical protein KZZ52_46750 [Dactylosporangium sp. AC04546]
MPQLGPLLAGAQGARVGAAEDLLHQRLQGGQAVQTGRRVPGQPPPIREIRLYRELLGLVGGAATGGDGGPFQLLLCAGLPVAAVGGIGLWVTAVARRVEGRAEYRRRVAAGIPGTAVLRAVGPRKKPWAWLEVEVSLPDRPPARHCGETIVFPDELRPPDAWRRVPGAAHPRRLAPAVPQAGRPPAEPHRRLTVGRRRPLTGRRRAPPHPT